MNDVMCHLFSLNCSTRCKVLKMFVRVQTVFWIIIKQVTALKKVKQELVTTKKKWRNRRQKEFLTIWECLNSKKSSQLLPSSITPASLLQDRGGSRIFFRRGCTRLLLYFNTNKPQFFLHNTSCIRKPQVISGGRGGAHPLHPPPRSAPARDSQVCKMFLRLFCFEQVKALKNFSQKL